MRVSSYAAAYAILVGISMLGMWSMFYIAGSIPELETRPMEIALHLLGERCRTAFFTD